MAQETRSDILPSTPSFQTSNASATDDAERYTCAFENERTQQVKLLNLEYHARQETYLIHCTAIVYKFAPIHGMTTAIPMPLKMITGQTKRRSKMKTALQRDGARNQLALGIGRTLVVAALSLFCVLTVAVSVNAEQALNLDFADLVAGGLQGQTYLCGLQAKPEAAPMNVQVLADWNQDGTFDEQAETVGQINLSDSRFQFIQVTVPTDALPGETAVRIRTVTGTPPVANSGYKDLTIRVAIPTVAAGIVRSQPAPDASSAIEVVSLPVSEPEADAPAVVAAPAPELAVRPVAATAAPRTVAMGVPKAASASVKPVHGTVEITVAGAEGGLVSIIVADESPDAEWRTLATAAGSFTFVDTNALGHLQSRFYRVVQEADGMLVTNPVLFGAHGRVLPPKTLSRMAVPICPSGEDRLDRDLGRQLAQGLSGGNAMTGDLLYVKNAAGAWKTYRLNANEQWVNDADGTPSCERVVSSQGFWVLRRSGTSNETVIYAGPTPTTAEPLPLLADSWQIVAWPFASAKWEDEGQNKGWGFASAGATRGTTWGNADQLIIENADGIEYLWLNKDGRWCRWNQTTPATDVALASGIGYYYYHRGAPFTWTPTAD